MALSTKHCIAKIGRVGIKAHHTMGYFGLESSITMYLISIWLGTFILKQSQSKTVTSQNNLNLSEQKMEAYKSAFFDPKCSHSAALLSLRTKTVLKTIIPDFEMEQSW